MDSMAAPRPMAVVGIALKKEKRKKHISDKLVAAAEEAGITLRFIDKEQPLEAQGPFVAILQKVRKPEWERELEAYAAAHPETRVFDMPAATYPLRNRGTMVSFLDGEGWVFEEPAAQVEPGRRPQRCRCNVPTNTTLAAGASFEAAMAQVEAAGLTFPMLAKPLWADGRDGSHALAVVHTPGGLQRLVAGEAPYLQLPIMLQQYVEHGGCLFKVYVLGDTYVRVKRSSLHLPPWTWITPPPTSPTKDSSQGQQQAAAPAAAEQAEAADGQAAAAAGAAQQRSSQAAGQLGVAMAAKGAVETMLGEDGQPDLELMERVSAYPASKSWGRADTAPKGHGVPSPPAWLLQALAQRLRSKTGLSLFNFDVIVPMHLHRRRPHATSSAAEAATGPPAERSSSIAAVAAAAVAEVVASAAQHLNGGGTVVPAAAGQPAADEEPVAVDLREAVAAEAAAASASGSLDAEVPQQAAQQAQQQQQQVQQAQQQKQQQQAQPQGQPQAQQQQQQASQQAAGEPGDPQELLYHLIDINYFPGYEKMPDYEDYIIQFLRSVASPEQHQ